jgi:hypothetical protein
MEGKSIGLETKIRPQRRAHDLENQDLQARVQGKVHLKDSICFK